MENIYKQHKLSQSESDIVKLTESNNGSPISKSASHRWIYSTQPFEYNIGNTIYETINSDVGNNSIFGYNSSESTKPIELGKALEYPTDSSREHPRPFSTTPKPITRWDDKSGPFTNASNGQLTVSYDKRTGKPRAAWENQGDYIPLFDDNGYIQPYNSEGELPPPYDDQGRPKSQYTGFYDNNKQSVTFFDFQGNPTFYDSYQASITEFPSNYRPDTDNKSYSDKEQAGPKQPTERDRKVYILNKLKKLEKKGKLSIMTEGARGILQLNNTIASGNEERYKCLGSIIRDLRDQIISHDLEKPWPDNAIEKLENVQSELNKPRKNNNKLTQSLQDQIETFSYEMIKSAYPQALERIKVQLFESLNEEIKKINQNILIVAEKTMLKSANNLITRKSEEGRCLKNDDKLELTDNNIEMHNILMHKRKYESLELENINKSYDSNNDLQNKLNDKTLLMHNIQVIKDRREIDSIELFDHFYQMYTRTNQLYSGAFQDLTEECRRIIERSTVNVNPDPCCWDWNYSANDLASLPTENPNEGKCRINQDILVNQIFKELKSQLEDEKIPLYDKQLTTHPHDLTSNSVEARPHIGYPSFLYTTQEPEAQQTGLRPRRKLSRSDNNSVTEISDSISMLSIETSEHTLLDLRNKKQRKFPPISHIEAPQTRGPSSNHTKVTTSNISHISSLESYNSTYSGPQRAEHLSRLKSITTKLRKLITFPIDKQLTHFLTAHNHPSDKLTKQPEYQRALTYVQQQAYQIQDKQYQKTIDSLEEIVRFAETANYDLDWAKTHFGSEHTSRILYNVNSANTYIKAQSQITEILQSLKKRQEELVTSNTEQRIKTISPEQKAQDIMAYQKLQTVLHTYSQGAEKLHNRAQKAHAEIQQAPSHLQIFFQYYPEKANQLMEFLSEYYLKKALEHFQTYARDKELLQEREQPPSHSEFPDPAVSETDPTATTHHLDPYQRIAYIAELNQQQAHAHLHKIEQIAELIKDLRNSTSHQISNQWQQVQHLLDKEPTTLKLIDLQIERLAEKEYIATKYLVLNIKELSDLTESRLRLYRTNQANTQEVPIKEAIRNLKDLIKDYNKQEETLKQIYQRCNQLHFDDEPEVDRFSPSPPSSIDNFTTVVLKQPYAELSQDISLPLRGPYAELSQDISLPLRGPYAELSQDSLSLLQKSQMEQGADPTNSTKTSKN